VIRDAADLDVVVMRHALITAALLGALLLAGCGGDDMPAAAAPGTGTIAIADFLYSPSPATVQAGTKVAISNADAAPHTLTDRAPGRAFDSGTIKGNATGSVTFASPGTYAYFCEFHPYMKGTVTVTG
jgi:plastocyanin